MNTTKQMEIRLPAKETVSVVRRRQRRSSRARWWFAQMRNEVEKAFDWGAVDYTQQNPAR